MKKVFYFLSFLVVFASCSKDDENVLQEEKAAVLEIKESSALRISLENIKQIGNSSAKLANEPELCFQFEYPILLEYNNGSQVSVSDYPQLLDILLNETMDLHITAIGFPFNVVQYSDYSSLTVNDESEFQSLVVGCGYDPVTVTQVVGITDNCFEIVYPVTVIVDDLPQTFSNQTEAEDYFLNNIQSITSLSIQYPLAVTMVENNTEVQINNDFELITLVNTTCGIN